MNAQAMASYEALLGKVEAKFNDIVAAYPRQFACQKGCYQCCQAGIGVFKVEKDHIAAYLAARPALVQHIASLQSNHNHTDGNVDPGDQPGVVGPASPRSPYCAFLGQSGECTIYPVRPVICRSHGAPNRFRQPVLPTPAKDPCLPEPSTAGLAEVTAVPKDSKPSRTETGDAGGTSMDVCPLNFSSLPLAELPTTMAFDLDTLNTILALINAAYTGHNGGERYTLNLDEITR